MACGVQIKVGILQVEVRILQVEVGILQVEVGILQVEVGIHVPVEVGIPVDILQCFQGLSNVKDVCPLGASCPRNLCGLGGQTVPQAVERRPNEVFEILGRVPN